MLIRQRFGWHLGINIWTDKVNGNVKGIPFAYCRTMIASRITIIMTMTSSIIMMTNGHQQFVPKLQGQGGFGPCSDTTPMVPRIGVRFTLLLLLLLSRHVSIKQSTRQGRRQDVTDQGVGQFLVLGDRKLPVSPCIVVFQRGHGEQRTRSCFRRQSR